jgi:predicted ABC-type ATPase
MLAELGRHFQAGKSFAFETTLSGRAYLKHIKKWQAAGYWIELIFLQLNHPDEAVARVQQRVRQGGHDIPEIVIRRRFSAGLENFHQHYAPVVNAWALYNNAGNTPVLLDWSER